jgi:hypothetical protein
VQGKTEETRFLAGAVLASLAAIALISLLPALNTAARLAPWAGVLGGFAYTPTYWAWRFKRTGDQRAVLIFCCLFAIPGVALGLVRVPYSVPLYSAGFIVSMTGGMWLGTVVDRLSRLRTTEVS